MKTLSLALAVILINSFVTSIYVEPLVNIKSLGKIQGTISRSFYGREFFSFEGVPYALPPVGDLRFREPQNVEPWYGMLHANTQYECLQLNITDTKISGTEDCLYINIYTPTLSKHANLDVLVFIHGGHFRFSSAPEYRPEYLLNKDVVYISMNYRLGILGFLSTENDIVPGNNGIKDQQMALQWIQDHIRNFGGNPKSVTVTGTSAGGSSTTIHILSPRSKGLIHRAIPRSGVVTNPWSLTEKHLEKTLTIAKILGCQNEDLELVIECLRNVDGTLLVNTTRALQVFPYGHQNPIAIAIDTWASDPVLPEHPYLLLKQGKVANDVPVLFSYVGAEGLYPGADYYDDAVLEDIDRNWNQYIPYMMLYEDTVDASLQDETSQQIRQYYLGNDKLTKSNFIKLIEALSDRFFLHEIYKSMDLLKLSLKSPVYFNYFDYEGANSLYRVPFEDRQGVGHYADISFVYNTDFPDTSTTISDLFIVETMVNIHLVFAKYGQPLWTGWKPLKIYESEFEATGLLIDNKEISVGKKFYVNGQFWNSLPIMENEKLFS